MLGPVFYVIHPIITEVLVNLFALCFSEDSYRKELLAKEEWMSNKENYPIIYHNRYNVTACGIEKLHPFDAQKYGRVFQHLRDKKIVSDLSKVYEPKGLKRALHNMTVS